MGKKMGKKKSKSKGKKKPRNLMGVGERMRTLPLTCSRDGEMDQETGIVTDDDGETDQETGIVTDDDGEMDQEMGIVTEPEKTMILLRQRRKVQNQTSDIHPTQAWSAVTWNGSTFSLSSLDKNWVQRDGMLEITYPDNIESFNGSSTAVWKSRLFFISGQCPARGCTMPTLHSLDIVSGCWLQHKPILTPRSFHTAWTVGDSIYVSGNSIFDEEGLIPPEHWGERYDIVNDTWVHLPKPPEPLYQFGLLRASAVYYNCQAFSYTTPTKDIHRVEENQNLILFPLPKFLDLGTRICVFHCEGQTWLPDICLDEFVPPIYPHFPTPHRVLRGDRLAIVDGVLFWHHCGHINGYHLVNQKYHCSLFTFPLDQQEHHLEYPDYHPRDQLVFFFHAGDHKLQIVFQITHNKHTIHCYQFLIKTEKQGQEGTHFHLVREGYTLLSTESMKRKFIIDALFFVPGEMSGPAPPALTDD